MNSQKRDRIFYWCFTAPFALIMALSAVGYLTEAPEMVAGFAHLGYPTYLLKILGIAKLLGATAIVYGRFSLLKEWAYAGFTINFAGAMASHLLSGDPISTCVGPLAFLTLALFSYAYWKKGIVIQATKMFAVNR